MKQHQFYTDADKDLPPAICDGNGSVVLTLCKVCGQAEVEVTEECPGAPATSGVPVEPATTFAEVAKAVMADAEYASWFPVPPAGVEGCKP